MFRGEKQTLNRRRFPTSRIKDVIPKSFPGVELLAEDVSLPRRTVGESLTRFVPE
jgi:hypothetical protein